MEPMKLLCTTLYLGEVPYKIVSVRTTNTGPTELTLRNQWLIDVTETYYLSAIEQAISDGAITLEPTENS